MIYSLPRRELAFSRTSSTRSLAAPPRVSVFLVSNDLPTKKAAITATAMPPRAMGEIPELARRDMGKWAFFNCGSDRPESCRDMDGRA